MRMVELIEKKKNKKAYIREKNTFYGLYLL